MKSSNKKLVSFNACSSLFLTILVTIVFTPVGHAEAYPFEMTTFIKKDVQLNQRVDSWGGIKRLSGEIIIEESEKTIVKLDKVRLIVEYGKGLGEIKVPQMAMVSELFSREFIETRDDASEIFVSGDDSLLLTLKPVLNAIIGDRSNIKNIDSNLSWDTNTVTSHFIGKSSELWLTSSDEEVRFVFSSGIGQKQVEIILAWLLTGKSDFLDGILKDRFEVEKPSFDIYFGTIRKR